MGGPAQVVVRSRNGAGVGADAVFKQILEVGGGKGGGNARLAQGGGFDPAQLPAMEEAARAAAQ